MNLRINKRHISLAIAIFILYLAIRYWDAVAKFIQLIFSAAIPLLIGCVIAYIVNLLLKQYERLYLKIFKSKKAYRFRRLFSILLSYLSIIIICALVVSLVIPELVSCIKLLFANHSHVINRFISYLQENGTFKGLWKSLDPHHFNWAKLSKYASYGFSGTLKTVMSTASSIFSALTTTVIAIFFSIYLLVYKEMLLRQCQKILNTYCGKIKQPLTHIVKTFDDCYSSYIVGQCKDAAILGIACFIGMKALGMPYASMIGVVTFFGALIPIIGAILGAGIGVVLIFAVSPIKSLVFLIFIIVLQQFDNRVTYPLVVGKSIGLPSVWVFAAVIIGGRISGILGMMLTVPLFAAIYRLVAEDVARRKHSKN